jgi:hypothetical protein
MREVYKNLREDKCVEGQEMSKEKRREVRPDSTERGKYFSLPELSDIPTYVCTAGDQNSAWLQEKAV